MVSNVLCVAVTALMVTAFACFPNAREKKKTKYRADSATLSLDGRNTNRARVRSSTFLYDRYGVPVGLAPLMVDRRRSNGSDR